METLNLVTALIHNTGTVFLGATVIALLGDKLNRGTRTGQALIGFVLGCAGLLSMAQPVVVAGGFLFDARIAAVTLAGPIGGPHAALVTTIMLGALRIVQGGPGAAPGVIGIVLAGIAGIVFDRVLTRKARSLARRDLVYCGIIAASIPFLSSLWVSNRSAALALLSGPAPIMAITNFSGVLLAGLIVVWDRERRALDRRLEEARVAAVSANASKTSFLGHLTHELRSPLAAMIAGTRLIIAQRHGSLGDRRYLDYARAIHKSGTHLAALIEDLLDLSSIEMGKITLSKESMELSDLIDESVQILKASAEAAGVVLHAGDVAECHLYADRKRLRQVLINLISNAVKFTPPGGEVILSAKAFADGSCQIAVRDNGIGIPPEAIQTIFDPYKQADNAVNRKGGGSGLGLFLSKRFVELHSGTLTIESNANSGTLVRMTLPSASAIVRSTSAPSHSRFAHRGEFLQAVMVEDEYFLVVGQSDHVAAPERRQAAAHRLHRQTQIISDVAPRHGHVNTI